MVLKQQTAAIIHPFMMEIQANNDAVNCVAPLDAAQVITGEYHRASERMKAELVDRGQ